MKNLTLLIALFFSIHVCTGQIISQFSWDSNPVTVADVGPNAISVSSSAVSDAGGVGSTNGLNPSLSGTPKLDVNFTLPGSPIFDVPGIDFSIDYHREESDARFFTRGSSLVISAGNQFNVSYRVEDGAGGFNTVSSGNVYPIPNDDTYRNYRFYYLPSTGEGFLLVDGVQIWTNDGPDNRDMYWVGAGNIIIGERLDGSGNNDTHLDNLIIGSVINSALPIKLTKFKVTPVNTTAIVEWRTDFEENNDYFEIEKSKNGKDWQFVGSVDGAGNSVAAIDYEYRDYQPFAGISYYRLKQIDFDGQLEIFEPVSVDFASILNEISVLSVFPNPAQNQITIGLNYINNTNIRIMTASGKLMQQVVNNDLEALSLVIDITHFSAGTYIISDGNSTVKFIKQ